METDPRVERSWLLYEHALEIIPGGTQTISRRPNRYAPGVYPCYIERAEGCHLWDIDGNEYIDFLMGVGPIILGYCDDVVDGAVKEQISRGSIFSFNCPLEVTLVEKIVELVPCAEMVRFSKTGADINSMALRIARAHTGREVVVYCGYHGWHDWYAADQMPGTGYTPLAGDDRTAGVPRGLRDYVRPFAYNDLESLEDALAPGDVAAIIMEATRFTAPQPGFLEGVRALADGHGAVLIFDEIVTGFRWALGGAQQYFGVTPDLATFAKAISNGYALAAVAGREEIMRRAGTLAITTTYGSEAYPFAAALACLGEIERRGHSHLWELGQRLKDGFNELAAQRGVSVQCIGYPPVTSLHFRHDEPEVVDRMRRLFCVETARRGIIWPATIGYVSYSHTSADIDQALAAADGALRAIAQLGLWE